MYLLPEEEQLSLVEEAAGKAELLETIREQMPNGINTTIGDRSEVNLSDGQTQRLSLARGFVKGNAELMFFDEPTSALDPVVEGQITGAKRSVSFTLSFLVLPPPKLLAFLRSGAIHAHLARGGRRCGREPLLFLALPLPSFRRPMHLHSGGRRRSGVIVAHRISTVRRAAAFRRKL